VDTKIGGILFEGKGIIINYVTHLYKTYNKSAMVR
jgi:hypothetical protein